MRSDIKDDKEERHAYQKYGDAGCESFASSMCLIEVSEKPRPVRFAAKFN